MSLNFAESTSTLATTDLDYAVQLGIWGSSFPPQRPVLGSTVLLPSEQETTGPREDTTAALPSSIFANWQELSRAELSNANVDRLIGLASKAEGWKGAGSRSLQPGAIRTFLTFWAHVNAKVEPFVTSTTKGGLYIEWHASWKRHLDLEFAPDGRVFLALIEGEQLVEAKTTATDAAKLIMNRTSDPTKWRLG